MKGYEIAQGMSNIFCGHRHTLPVYIGSIDFYKIDSGL
jgi:hypothetical protein